MVSLDHVVTIKTMGSFFDRLEPQVGVWSAGLTWFDEFEGVGGQELESGRDYDLANRGRNVAADVMAILHGLRRAEPMGLPIEVHTANQASINTINEYLDKWANSGWLKSDGKPPACLEEWQEIKAIADRVRVTAYKRPKGKVDHVGDLEAFDELVAQRDNDFWMQRAMERDPWG
jgi:ribonuclease HI